MSRQLVVFFGVALAFVFTSVNCSTEALGSGISVTVVQNLTEYLEKNPDVKLLEPLIAEIPADGPSPRLKITHKVGQRIKGNLKIFYF